MGTVLFAWELGGGFGHVGPMKVLAERLSKQGHRAVFAAKDVIAARTVLDGLGPILQAPALERPPRLQPAFGAGSFADMLALRGYGDPKFLGPAVDSWTDLFRLVDPDLLIADFSPTALLAAYARLPAVSVGYGFYLPPDHLPRFPAYRDDVPPILGEAAILASAARVLAERGGKAPASLPALFRTHYSHLYSLPPLDPYAAYRRTPGFGPIEPMPVPSAAPREPRVFAYLSDDHPQIANLVVALDLLDRPVELLLRSQDRALASFARRRGIAVHDRPPPLPEVMSRSSLVLSHGSGGISHAAFLAGRPQILFPRHAEQQATARLLEQLGCARSLAAEAEPPLIAAAVTAALTAAELRQSAEACALKAAASFHPGPRLRALLEVCKELLAEGAARRAQGAKPQPATSIP
jgi:hypothetical protein